MISELVGGLAFFLYGMSTMSKGLEKMAGGKLESALKSVTGNPFSSFSLGAGITIAIQSSSAMTVMLVGLVNSGILAFGDTFSIIMGSNVGTTLTSWILILTGVSGDNFFLTILKPMTFSMFFALVGIIFQTFSKSEKKKSIGIILLGFAILMTGMNLMSGSMSAVQESSAFRGLLTAFENPVVALLASTVFTGVIQSSAATVGIVQALALTGSITYQVAIPLVLGANIGTCMTAVISSFGTSKEAKRVVALHTYIKIVGSILAMILLGIINLITPDLMDATIGMLGVAAVHTAFNVANTVVLLPFKKPMLKLCKLTIRENQEEEKHAVFLDERIFKNPPLAISECRRLTTEMANIAREALYISLETLDEYNDGKVTKVVDAEDLTDKYEDKLGTYLVRISQENITEHESRAIGRMLHSIGDYERIADHAMNICDVAKEIHEKNIVFSAEAQDELKNIISAVTEIVDMTIDSYINDDLAEAAMVEPLEQVIDKLKDTLREKHVERLQRGECTVKMGFVFNDLLVNLERVSDHCSNIAVYTLQVDTGTADAHKYLHEVKESTQGEFVDDFRHFSDKYDI